MAGGPLYPESAVPSPEDEVGPSIYTGGGSGSTKESGMGVVASLGSEASDLIWNLRFRMPGSLPSGTAKLHLIGVANASSGAAKINAKWAMVNPSGGQPSATLSAEGASTVTWSAADRYQELKVTLDAAGSITAGYVMAMALTFEKSSWTLAQPSVWRAAIIWE